MDRQPVTPGQLKIIIAPGAFKHSLSANQVAEAIGQGLRRSGLDASLHNQPIADGGNGTVDAWLAGGGEQVHVPVHDPLMRPIEATYGILPDGETAVIEMAQASGIELLSDDERDPLRTTTYGTGELMQHALSRGLRRFIIGMGGSATVDGGSGALSALGVRLLDADGQVLPPGGGSLNRVSQIDSTGLDPHWQDCEIIIASDVDNPTLGDTGAAAVFGPQKGATPEQVNQLETCLSHFFKLIHEHYDVEVRQMPGGGAAGALSAGLLAFLPGRLESGIDLLLQHTDFVTHLASADLVITGEGQMDSQTIHGKGPMGVARLANQHGVPTVAIVGGLAVDDAVLYDAGLQAVLPVVTQPVTLSEALANAAQQVERAALRLGYLLQLNQQWTEGSR